MSIMKFQKFIPIILVNIVALFVYFYIISSLGLKINSQTMFATNDAKTYWDVAKWITEGIPTESTTIRPVLYPILLSICSKIGGVSAIWLLQFLMWLASINLTFLSIKSISKSIVWPTLGTLLIISNLSFIALTFHALTEVATIFLLTIVIFLSIKNRDKLYEFSFFKNVLLIFVLLTILKPVFYIPLLGLLFIILPFVYLRKMLNNKKQFITLLLILSPLLVQLSIMKIKHDKITVSTIGQKTIDEYIITQSYEDKLNIERDSALIQIKSMSSDEKNNFVKQNLNIVLNRFKLNLQGNILSAPDYIMSFVSKPNKKLTNYMIDINRLYYKLHFYLLILTLPFLYLLYKKKEYNLLFISLFFILLNSYFLLTTGISFYQGDRLVLPAIGIFSFLYIYMSKELFTSAYKFIQSKIQLKK